MQKLENPHVIDTSQVEISVLGRGDCKQFNFKMQTRNDEAMIQELGQTLKTIAASVQGGILMFFPSYSYMD